MNTTILFMFRWILFPAKIQQNLGKHSTRKRKRRLPLDPSVTQPRWGNMAQSTKTSSGHWKVCKYTTYACSMYRIKQISISLGLLIFLWQPYTNIGLWCAKPFKPIIPINCVIFILIKTAACFQTHDDLLILKSNSVYICSLFLISVDIKLYYLK